MYLSEQEEKQYLTIIIQKLKSTYKNIDLQIANTSKDIIESKKYIWDNIAQLDLAEKTANRTAIHNAIDFGEKAKIKKGRIEKMIQSPYFGRIDFTSIDSKIEKEYYIGIHSFSDTAGKENLIYDWRAPLPSMYYDFEAGEAYYQAPIGLIQGEITRKLQYKIKNCNMEYMLESALSISDEVLQKELSSTADMKFRRIAVYFKLL